MALGQTLEVFRGMQISLRQPKPHRHDPGQVRHRRPRSLAQHPRRSRVRVEVRASGPDFLIWWSGHEPARIESSYRPAALRWKVCTLPYSRPMITSAWPVLSP